MEAAADRGSRAMARRFAPAMAEPASTPARRGVKAIASGIFTYRASEPTWRRPSLNLLNKAAVQRPGPEATSPLLRGSARLLEDALRDFGIAAVVKSIRPGPVVTAFEIEPERGTKVSRIVALADDIARAMSAQSARVAPVPGRNTVAIELPNVRRDTVQLRDVLESEAWRGMDGALPIALGKGVSGEPVVADLARMPHVLIAGAPGSGLSATLDALIASLLWRHAPDDCRLVLIDPKMLELASVNGVPHLLAPVVVDAARGVAALAWAVGEMDERYKRMAELGVRNVELYNNRVRNAKKRGELMARRVQTGFDEATGEPRFEEEALDLVPLPAIVVIVGELADLMAAAGRDVEAAIERVARLGRAAGIHVVLATARPTPDIVTPALKASLPSRIALKLASKADSRTVLDDLGAEQLLGLGDMLVTAGPGQFARVHGALVTPEEVEQIAAHWREQAEIEPDESLMQALARAAGEEGTGRAMPQPGAVLDTDSSEDDDLFDRAAAIVHRERRASTSTLQRRLGISFARAAEIMARLEREGLVSAPDGAGRRQVATGAGR